MSEANRHAQSKDPYTPIRARRPRGVLSALSGAEDREGHEYSCHISPARVGRTLLSDAFDLDLDSDFAQRARTVQYRGRADASAPRKGPNKNPASAADPRPTTLLSRTVEEPAPSEAEGIPTLPHVPQTISGSSSRAVGARGPGRARVLVSHQPCSCGSDTPVPRL
jgi:hypothetical protein